MSNDNERGPSISPLPFIALLLIAAGILVKTVPLETMRPAGDERAGTARQPGMQNVEARLWEDPLVVRAAAMPSPETARRRDALAAQDPEHATWTLADLVDREIEGGEDFAILGATVLGGTHPEDAEARRRVRFAVVAGLQELGYEPDNAGAIGYIWLSDRPRAPRDVDARLPEVLPYEWYTRTDASGTTRLLLAWIQEDALGGRPVRALNRLAEALLCGSSHAPEERTAACAARMRQTRFRIVGPVDSGTLRAMWQEVRELTPADARGDRDEVPLELFSAVATLPDQRLPGIDLLDKPSVAEAADVPARRLRLTRLTARDDALAGALAFELVRLRGLADPKPSPGAAPGRRCGVVALVTEADTTYGRALGDEVRREIERECERVEAKPPRVVPIRYFRGLDGMVPEASGSGGRSSAADAKRRGADELEVRTAPHERADGRSQFDYLRRLSAELAELDAAERRAGHAGVRAVGILGSDLYDKLLVLQALRAQLPYAVFFTTDLDARLLHPDQNAWTRNLVVASAFGLTLRDALQGTAPPFRDTYQTGIYFATRFALQPALQAAFQTPLDDDANGFRRLGDQWFSRVQVFEIGRSRAVELTRGGGRQMVSEVPEACTIETPAGCAVIAQDPERDGTSRAVQTLRPYRWFFALACLAVALLVLFTSRTVRQHPRAAAVAISLGLAVVAWVTSRAIDDDGSGLGEPLELFEGVSLWPTVYLRLFTIALTIGFLVAGWTMMKRQSMRLHREFFSAHLAGAPRAPRSAGGDGLLTRIAGPLHVPIERFMSRVGLRPAFIEQRAGRGRTLPEGLGNRRRSLLALLPANAYGWSPSDARGHLDRATGKLDARSLWRVHCCLGRFWLSALRVGLMTALFTLAVIGLFVFDPPNLPYRGAEVKSWANATTLASVFFFYLLLFAVLDLTRRATRFVRLLSTRPTSWPPRTMAREERRTGLRGPLLEAWLAFRVTAAVGQQASRFIYFPFIVLLLLVVARTTLFDSLNLPLPLVVVFSAAVLYLVYCSASLRRAAEAARTRTLRVLNEFRLGLASGAVPDGLRGAAPPGDGAARVLGAQIDELRRRIEQEREGALASVFNQPVVKALMIPFGGFGGLQLLEYFAISPF